MADLLYADRRRAFTVMTIDNPQPRSRHDVLTAQRGGPNRENVMSASQLAIDRSVAGAAAEEIGPLEQRHLRSAAFRAASDNTKVTSTHWHIAVANGLGWGFDGMDGVIFAIVTPFVIKEFAVDLGTYAVGRADRDVHRHCRAVFLAVAGGQIRPAHVAGH